MTIDQYVQEFNVQHLCFQHENGTLECPNLKEQEKQTDHTCAEQNNETQQCSNMLQYLPTNMDTEQGRSDHALCCKT